MKRALSSLVVLALAGCGSHSKPKPRPPASPELSTLLARGKSVHFVLSGTITLQLQPLLARFHPVSPLHINGRGDASRAGLKADGTLRGDFSGSGTVAVAGRTAYGRVGGTWYDLGQTKPAAELLRGAHWTTARGPNGRPRMLHGALHLTTGQLERLSGLSVPFGIDRADIRVTLHLSRWGEHVRIPRPRRALPLPRG